MRLTIHHKLIVILLLNGRIGSKLRMAAVSHISYANLTSLLLWMKWSKWRLWATLGAWSHTKIAHTLKTQFLVNAKLKTLRSPYLFLSNVFSEHESIVTFSSYHTHCSSSSRRLHCLLCGSIQTRWKKVSVSVKLKTKWVKIINVLPWICKIE